MRVTHVALDLLTATLADTPGVGHVELHAVIQVDDVGLMPLLVTVPQASVSAVEPRLRSFAGEYLRSVVDPAVRVLLSEEDG